MHFEWIKELKRVLKPNGILIITTHGKFTRNRLLLHEKQLFDSGKLVVRDGLQEGKKLYLAYHPPEFIKDKLLKNSKIVSCARYSDTDLDIWVARK